MSRRHKLGTAILGSLFAFSLLASPCRIAADGIGAEEIQRVSKAFGHMVGKRLGQPDMPLDVDAVVEGIRDGAAGKAAPMPDDEYHRWMQRIQDAAYDEIAQDNLRSAEAFLSKNSKIPAVVQLEQGKVQIRTIAKGKGERVAPHAHPLLRFTGRFADGTVFSSSDDAGGEVVIPLDQAISGFSLGVEGMQEGERREIVLHPDFAYGTSGQLPPNALLIFDVRLIQAEARSSEQIAKTEEEIAPPEKFERPRRPITLEFGVDPATLDFDPDFDMDAISDGVLESDAPIEPKTFDRQLLGEG